MERCASLFAVLLVSSLAACGTDGQRAGSAEEEAHRRPAPPALGPVQLIDVDAPLDVRALRIDPELHVGKERVCDVLIAGQPQTLDVRTAIEYPVPAAARRLVRCGAPTGEGWADLIFPPASAGLISDVTGGKRLRVAVVAAAGGFEDAPILAFVAVIGDAPAAGSLPEDFQSIRAGFDFGGMDARPELRGMSAICAVAYASAPEAIAEEQLDRYPGGATHRLGLVCGHARGDAWVDLVFTAEQADDVLALRRGARARLRILAVEGGAAGLPIATIATGEAAGS